MIYLLLMRQPLPYHRCCIYTSRTSFISARNISTPILFLVHVPVDFGLLIYTRIGPDYVCVCQSVFIGLLIILYRIRLFSPMYLCTTYSVCNHQETDESLQVKTLSFSFNLAPPRRGKSYQCHFSPRLDKEFQPNCYRLGLNVIFITNPFV